MGTFLSMAGLIKARGHCPNGGRWSTSKHGEPILCGCGRNHQPKSYFIEVWWQDRTWRLYYDAAGERLDSLPRAARCLQVIRGGIDAGDFAPDAHLKDKSGTVGIWWAKWETGHRSARSTRDKLKSIRLNNLGPLADRQVKKVRSFHLSEWWTWLEDRNLSPKYRNDCLTWIRSFFKWAWGQEIIQALPRTFPDPAQVVAEPIAYLTADQQAALLEALPETYRPIFWFLSRTGCRIMEAAALRHADVDRAGKIITFRHSLDRHGDLGPVKNRRPRRFPLLPEVEAALPKMTGLEFIFLNRWGRHFSYEDLRETFHAARELAKLPRIEMKNAFRHSLAMRLTAAGAPSWEVSKIMGHTTQAMTDRYRELLTDRMAEILTAKGEKE